MRSEALEEMEEIRFIADAMVGRLARWLRILGYDVRYIREVSDPTLSRLAAEEGRIILTRDTRFYAEFENRSIFVEGDRLEDQLKNLVSRFPVLKRVHPFERCSLCNGEIKGVKRETIRGRVPEFVYKTQQEFSSCEGCGRVYWQGSHLKGIRERIERVLKGVDGED